MNDMKITRAKLKSWYDVVQESGGTELSTRGASTKIYHRNTADVTHNPSIARDYNREHTGSPKGYICIHTDYTSMFGRWVKIGAKYNRNGTLNKKQCIVYGNRTGCKAFNAYFDWFEEIEPLEINFAVWSKKKSWLRYNFPPFNFMFFETGKTESVTARFHA